MNHRESRGQFLFYLSYLPLLIDALIIKNTTFGQFPHMQFISLALYGTAAVFVILKLLLDRFYTLPSILFIVCSGLLLSISFIRSNYNHLFYLLIVLLGSRHIHIQRILRLDYFLRLIILFVIIASSLLGVIENYITYRTNSEILRYSLGFTHPNGFAAYILVLILEDSLIFQRRTSLPYILFVWSIAAFTFVITDNRTSVLLTAIYPILLLSSFIKHPEKHLGRISRCILTWFFPLTVFLSCLSVFLLNRFQYLKIIDAFLTNRIFNAARVLNTYGLSLFGQQVELVSVKAARARQTSIALLDIAYPRMLIQAGPIILILFIFMYICLCRKLIAQNDRHALLVIIIFAVFGLCESTFNNVCINFTILHAVNASHKAISKLSVSSSLPRLKYAHE